MNISLPLSKNKYNFNQHRANLYYADILVEISERLQIELDNSRLSLQELQEILGINDDYYLEGILECFEDLSIKELANIFSVFEKVLSIVPLSQGEIAKTHTINKEIREYHLSNISSFNNDIFLICKKNELNYEDIALVRTETAVHLSSTSTLSLISVENDVQTISLFNQNENITDIELCQLK